MRAIHACLIAATVSLATNSSAAAQQTKTVKIATWNMAWLTERMPGTGGEGGVPVGVHHRTAADWKLVKKYAKRLGADIVAFEEVDGVAMAKKAYGASKYNFHTTDEPDVQKPGFAIRKGIVFARNPDFAALDVIASEPRSLRRGADITVQIAGQKIRMLAVHLKSGCPAQSLNSGGDNCPLLKQQLPILAQWVQQRVDEKIPFIILGDFNRVFEDQEEFWKAMNLDGNANLVRSTAGQPPSPCWGGIHPKFIDHIVFGGSTLEWIQTNTFKVLVYDETAKKFQDRISDHCPQSISLKVKKP
jgi:endonuclease/exonuclease/phosphatase family metal-dependent hydrolase